MGNGAYKIGHVNPNYRVINPPVSERLRVFKYVLSNRERRVVRLVANGYDPKYIARVEGIGEDRVSRIYRHNVRRLEGLSGLAVIRKREAHNNV